MAQISIIIPSYNSGLYLKSLIDSILKQSFENWELIIIDDGSTDNTTEIISEYKNRDHRIIFHQRKREPKGSVTCRNIGLEIANGEYIIHFDADDLISKNCLADRIRFMEDNPEVDYASFPAKVFSNESKLPKFCDRGKTYGKERVNIDLLALFLKADYPFSTWNNIYRKKSIEGIEWDENVKIYTDFSFIVPCILAGLKHKYSGKKELDYFYRVNNSKNAMTSSFVSPEKCESTIYLFKKTLESLGKRKDYKTRKKEFLDFMILHYERLLIGAETNDVKEFLNFINSAYNKFIFLKFAFIFKINSLRNEYLRRTFVWTFITILFLKPFYLKKIVNKK